MRRGFFWMCAILLMVALAAGTAFAKGATEQPTGTSSSAAATAVGTLPLTNQKVTLSVFFDNAEVQDPATNEYTLWLEQQTNVHINWVLATGDAASDKRALLLASGDYPDVFMDDEDPFSKADEEKYASQGLFIPLNSMIDKYGINVKKAFTTVPGVKQAITMPDGKIYSLPSVQDACYHCLYNQRMYIDSDWLKKLGLSVPTTTAELQKVLAAFKTQDPNGNGKADEIPMAVDAAEPTWGGGIGFLMNPFIYFDGRDYFYINSQGKVDFTATKPAFRSGLQYVRSLVQQGLLDQRSFVWKGDDINRAGSAPGGPVIGVTTGGTPGFTRDYWQFYVGVAPLQGPGGLRQTPYFGPPADTGAFEITDKCKYPDIAFRWGDFQLSPDIPYHQNGTEGIAWRKGKPGEVDFMGRVPDMVRLGDYAQGQIPEKDAGFYGGISWYSWDFFSHNKVVKDPTQQGSDQSGTEWWLASITNHLMAPYVPKDVYRPAYLPLGQITEAAQLYTAVNSYVDQSIARFATGDLDINSDADWNNFLNQLNKLNVQKLVDIYGAAYETQWGGTPFKPVSHVGEF